ncbi:unnamed protein product [Natator depressus]
MASHAGNSQLQQTLRELLLLWTDRGAGRNLFLDPFSLLQELSCGATAGTRPHTLLRGPDQRLEIHPFSVPAIFSEKNDLSKIPQVGLLSPVWLGTEWEVLGRSGRRSLRVGGPRVPKPWPHPSRCCFP